MFKITEIICNLFVQFSLKYRDTIFQGKLHGSLVMRLLSRKEEMILLAIWKLQENAYGVTIRKLIEESTGVKWLFGALYDPLGKLLELGYIEARESEPVPERGGRRKTIYSLTKTGKETLLNIRELNSIMWTNIPPLKEEA